MVLDLNKNLGGLTDLEKKRHGSVDLHTPIHPLSEIKVTDDFFLKLSLNVLYQALFRKMQ